MSLDKHFIWIEKIGGFEGGVKRGTEAALEGAGIAAEAIGGGIAGKARAGMRFLKMFSKDEMKDISIAIFSPCGPKIILGHISEFKKNIS